MTDVNDNEFQVSSFVGRYKYEECLPIYGKFTIGTARKTEIVHNFILRGFRF